MRRPPPTPHLLRGRVRVRVRVRVRARARARARARVRAEVSVRAPLGIEGKARPDKTSPR